MRVRHRIPSIFNLSMVDVLCCALGCVILLWLLNLREAKYHQDSAEEEHRLAAARLVDMRGERDSAIGMLMRLQTQAEALEDEKADLQKSLSTLQGEAAELSRKLTTSAARVASLEGDVKDRVKRHEAETARAGELGRKLNDAAGRVAALERDLRVSDQRGERATARGRELSAELSAAKSRLKELQATADLVPSLRGDLKEARQQYAAEKAMAGALEKEIARRLRELKDAEAAADALKTEVARRSRELKDAGAALDELRSARRTLERDADGRDKELALTRRSLAELREQNKVLAGEAARVRAAAENRFAGIELTGRRVVFLVDASGSMELVDENTRAPTKWADVRNTVARLMRSLPDLEKYQVIVFAEKASFLFAGEPGWLDFDARTSAERVSAALAKVAPKGGTNMYAALQTAFGLRAAGLDTIYLLSDGLPNLGEGLDPASANTLREVERNDLLAKHIRRTLRDDWNRPQPGRPRVRVNAVGFFYESPDVGAFLWALSRENDGSFVGMSRP